jgi:preprotein translocase SecE subunit
MAEPNNQSKKRLVKNPETFRERAVKANTAQPKNQASVRSKSAIAKIVRPIGQVIKNFFSLRFFKIFRLPLKILGKILFVSYFVNSFKELKLVTFPKWPESRKLTYAVLSFAVVFGASIAGVDLVLGKIFRNLLLK